MNYQQIRSRLKEHGLEVFTTQEFINVTGIRREIAMVKLARYKAKGYLGSPKREVYYLAGEVWDKNRIANKIYYPSYISLDTALSKYGIIPETVYAITSITTKATREFGDENQTYRYYKIKKSAYTGYFLHENILIADPEKALTDYLYFVSLGKRKLNDRLNLEKIDKKKVLKYAELFKNDRLNKIIKNYVI